MLSPLEAGGVKRREAIMKIGEFCTRDVVITDRDATILQAAKLMRQHHVGDIVVVDAKDHGKVPVGIMTDRDIVIALLAEEVDLSRLTVGDAMGFDLHVAGEDDDLFETIELMQRRGIRRVPVVGSANELVGIITSDDVLEIVSEQLTSLIRAFGREHQIETERRH